MDKLIIVGWGRMGVTHASIINGLYPNRFKTTIVEQNKIIGLITAKTLNYEVFSNLGDVNIVNATVLITTPPSTHKELCNQALEHGANTVFVEKPFGIFDNRINPDKRISVGYVLRFTEVAQTLKKMIEEEGCKRINLDYSSNTLTKKPSGWRNSMYGGVLNEMGSHLLDLIFYLGEHNSFNVNSCQIKSVVSDVDDIVVLNGTLGDIEVNLSLNWVNKNYRKPVWSGNVETNSRSITFDQQSIEIGYNPQSVNYYVRGREFSMQMQHFIDGNKSIICDAEQANRVHNVIMKIKKYL